MSSGSPWSLSPSAPLAAPGTHAHSRWTGQSSGHRELVTSTAANALTRESFRLTGGVSTVRVLGEDRLLASGWRDLQRSRPALITPSLSLHPLPPALITSSLSLHPLPPAPSPSNTASLRPWYRHQLGLCCPQLLSEQAPAPLCLPKAAVQLANLCIQLLARLLSQGLLQTGTQQVHGTDTSATTPKAEQGHHVHTLVLSPCKMASRPRTASS